jgi:hypothetical protein
MEQDEPNLDWPMTLKALESFAKLRSDKALPRWVKSRIVILEPYRASPHTDNALEARTKQRSDSELPI